MKTIVGRTVGIGLLFGCLLLASAMVRIEARPRSGSFAAQPQVDGVVIGSDNIGGVVTSLKGPEAGVWVIAETTDFQTKLRKIVVTDDQGRYLLPELPKANYKVWVRGYGLVDSNPVMSTPGKNLNLTAVVAPDARAAAQYYPANYWYSLMEVPPKSDFPIKTSGVLFSEAGSTLHAPGIQPSQSYIVDGLHSGCEMCHQIGDKATREFPASLGKFDTHAQAWERRLMSGQFGTEMTSTFNTTFGHERGFAMFADWTERIAKGEVPPSPPRPQGMERNIVLTLWDQGSWNSFLHGISASDDRNPTLNGYGPVYSTDWERGELHIVDPRENTAISKRIPLRHEEERKTMAFGSIQSNAMPSPYWGDKIVWEEDSVNAAYDQMDSKGRIWVGMENRKSDPPNFCKASSNNPFAKNWEPPTLSRIGQPTEGWGVDIYDPKTGKFDAVDLCFSIHHLKMAYDKDETVYFALKIGQIGGVGWVNSRIWDETHDAEKAEGWCPPVIDYNGDGKTGAYTRAPQPLDPKLDRFVDGTRGYGISVNPVDGTVWVAIMKPIPGKILRFDRGSNPPSTCKTEIYEPPFSNDPKPGEKLGYIPRAVNFDTNGLAWTNLGGSGQLASFDRSKCKVLNGPTATGQHCPEGWTLYPVPGPTFKGETEAKADWVYFVWVDRFNILGLGKNSVVLTGTGSDSLLVFQPPTKTWTVMRVPYPLGFYSRDLNGRIDDPNVGWKGRGVWADNDTRTTWHIEGGAGTPSQLVHFQIRPDPLAR
jgi:hypothetical protein